MFVAFCVPHSNELEMNKYLQLESYRQTDHILEIFTFMNVDEIQFFRSRSISALEKNTNIEIATNEPLIQLQYSIHGVNEFY